MLCFVFNTSVDAMHFVLCIPSTGFLGRFWAPPWLALQPLSRTLLSGTNGKWIVAESVSMHVDNIAMDHAALPNQTRRYGLNVAFNLQNKVIFNYFPYPWFVSSIHVVVGTLYCALLYLVGLRNASFERVS